MCYPETEARKGRIPILNAAVAGRFDVFDASRRQLQRWHLLPREWAGAKIREKSPATGVAYRVAADSDSESYALLGGGSVLTEILRSTKTYRRKKVGDDMPS